MFNAGRDAFWSQISTDTKKSHAKIKNPILQILHKWMAMCLYQHANNHTVRDQEVEWLYCMRYQEQINAGPTMFTY